MIGPLCAAAAVLLLGSGLAKLGRPAGTARMLAELLGTRAGRLGAARLVGVVEVVVAALVVVGGARTACAALAACYLAFTIVAVRLVRGARPAPCGCFGGAEAPVGRVHVAVDSAACLAAVAGTGWPPGPWGGLAGQDALVTVVGLCQAVLLAGMAYVLVTVLPTVLAEPDRVVRPS